VTSPNREAVRAARSVVIKVGTTALTTPSGVFDASRLAVLADALEEAGWCDPEVLGHCRARTDHVRGCWVLDLILGKE
jgi:hypothetical protein